MYGLKEAGFSFIFPSRMASAVSENAPRYNAFESSKDDRIRKMEMLWKELCRKSLRDDVLFRMVMHRNTELLDFIAKLFIPGYEGGAFEVVSNYEMPHVLTKTSRLDVYAESEGCVINVEMQNEKSGWRESRIWQYNANMVNSFLLRGSSYDGLPKLVHLVFTGWDMYGEGKPYYALTMKDQDGVERDASVMFIYANMLYRGADRYGMFNHDLDCVDWRKMYYNEMRTSTEKIKSRRRGMEKTMSLFNELVEEYKEDAYNEGRYEGRTDGMMSFLRVLLAESSPYDISKKFNIPLDEVNAVAESLRM